MQAPIIICGVQGTLTQNTNQCSSHMVIKWSRGFMGTFLLPVVLVLKELLGKELWTLATDKTEQWTRHVKLALTFGQRSIVQILVELVGNSPSKV